MLEIMSTLLCELLVAVLRAVLKLRGGGGAPSQVSESKETPSRNRAKRAESQSPRSQVT